MALKNTLFLSLLFVSMIDVHGSYNNVQAGVLLDRITFENRLNHANKIITQTPPISDSTSHNNPINKANPILVTENKNNIINETSPSQKTKSEIINVVNSSSNSKSNPLPTQLQLQLDAGNFNAEDLKQQQHKENNIADSNSNSNTNQLAILPAPLPLNTTTIAATVTSQSHRHRQKRRGAFAVTKDGFRIPLCRKKRLIEFDRAKRMVYCSNKCCSHLGRHCCRGMKCNYIYNVCVKGQNNRV